jgi:hypothetical protein
MYKRASIFSHRRMCCPHPQHLLAATAKVSVRQISFSPRILLAIINHKTIHRVTANHQEKNIWGARGKGDENGRSYVYMDAGSAIARGEHHQ